MRLHGRLRAFANIAALGVMTWGVAVPRVSAQSIASKSGPSRGNPASAFSFQVIGDDPGPWPEILSSIGMVSGAAGGAGVVVVRAGTDAPAASDWMAKVEQGTLLVIEGE